jgi:glutamine cyclotransferase
MGDLKRVMKYAVPSFLILVIVISVSVTFTLNQNPEETQTKATTNVNFGIAFCGNTTKEAEVLIDRVKDYTNLFILDSGANPISRNQTAIEEICDYAVANGLNVIINLGHIHSQQSWFWQLPSLDGIKQRWTERWGAKFLGVYYNDEPGGIQLDGDWTNWFATHQSQLPQNPDLASIYAKMQEFKANGSSPQDYDLEANFFVHDVLEEDPGLSRLKAAGITTFTSDYGLYWFDYLGGYDVMLAQIGWNCSVAQQIDLVKGAARLQNKDWGAIITWKYGDYPYLDDGDQMYNQMLIAYQAGAKYIVVFDYPMIPGNPYGALYDQHFIAIERFWNDITNQEKTSAMPDLSQPEAAMVLPRNYGWGMRNPYDLIWGFWGPDDKSLQVGTVMGKLLAQYGVCLDIVYDDAAYPVSEGDYANVYYWNDSASPANPTPEPEPADSEPLQYTYTIVNAYPHDENAFTQGLIFDNGFLYEGTGLYGNSTLRRVDPATGDTLQLYPLPDQYFGEGITMVGDKIIQLTWQSNIGFVYDKYSFDLLQNFSYPTEGWGITYDGSQLIMSDGTSNLYFLDPSTFQKTGQVQVHDNEGPVTNINELEYVNGKVYANIWMEDKIAVINPQTGQVEAWINLSGIINLPNPDPNSVLNGIAYDANTGRLFVTGKDWPQLFEIKLVPLNQQG